MGRRVLIVIAIAALLTYAAVGWAVYRGREWVRLAAAEISDESKPWQEVERPATSFDVAAGRRLVIENRRGNVQVLPGSGEVTVEAIVSVRADTAAQAHRLAKPVTISGKPEGADAFRITVSRVRDDLRARTDLVVHAPADLPVEIAASLGDVEVSDREAAVTVTNRAGNIEVRRGRGDVTIGNSAGNITISSVRGRVKTTVSAGEIEMHDLYGPVEARCSAGNVFLTAVESDDINASASMGNVDIRLTRPFSGRLAARTSAGNVTIAIPRGSRCRVETDVSLGQTNASLPDSITAGNPPGLITASSSMGNVEITEE